MNRSIIGSHDYFNLDLTSDTMVTADSSDVVHGLRWQIIVADSKSYHLEMALTFTGSDNVYIFKGCIIGDRVIGSIFLMSGSLNITNQSAEPVYFGGHSDSWLRKSLSPLERIGTFQMKKSSIVAEI